MPPLSAGLDKPQTTQAQAVIPPPTVQTQRSLPNIILSGRKTEQTNDTEQAATKSEPPSAVPSPDPTATQPAAAGISSPLISQPETNGTPKVTEAAKPVSVQA